MKRPEKNRGVRIVLVSILLLSCLSILHVDGKQSNISVPFGAKAVLVEWGAALYAAEKEQNTAGDEKAKEMQKGDFPTEETRDYVTPLRILSVIAMSIFLVWYIRRKLKL